MATPPPEDCDATVLDRLFAIIESRRGADPKESRTAELFARGPKKIAQKLGEEAVETILEAEAGDTAKLAAESADLLYHLLVLWAARGVAPAAVWGVLADRMGVSGIAEKRSRKID